MDERQRQQPRASCVLEQWGEQVDCCAVYFIIASFAGRQTVPSINSVNLGMFVHSFFCFLQEQHEDFIPIVDQITHSSYMQNIPDTYKRLLFIYFIFCTYVRRVEDYRYRYEYRKMN